MAIKVTKIKHLAYLSALIAGVFDSVRGSGGHPQATFTARINEG